MHQEVCMLLSYSAPFLAKLHPSYLRCTLELCLNAVELYNATFSSHILQAQSYCTLHTLSYAAPYWAVISSTELRCTLRSCATLCCATLHPDEVRCKMLSIMQPTKYAAPFWIMPHLLRNAAPYWATGHYWGTVHLTDLRCTHWTGLHPIELRRTLLSYAVYPSVSP